MGRFDDALALLPEIDSQREKLGYVQDTAALCQALLARGEALAEWGKPVGNLVRVYEVHEILADLARGVTKTIPLLFDREALTQTDCKLWRDA